MPSSTEYYGNLAAKEIFHMNRSLSKQLTVTGIAFAVCLSAPAIYAQEQDNEITMDILDSSIAGEETLGARIELPERAAERARERSAFGLETANQARERGREFGQERAAEAREAVKNAHGAKDKDKDKEPGDRGRPDRRPDLPDAVPDDSPARR
jgi:hypothetical protein